MVPQGKLDPDQIETSEAKECSQYQPITLWLVQALPDAFLRID